MNLQIVAVQHVPEIRVGTNLSECLREAVHRSGWNLQPRDILAVTQKAVSKAEGRITRLGDVVPSAYSVSIARRMSKDPRLVEIILRESRRIVRLRGEVLICETHHGFICANAGVDESNVEGLESVTLLAAADALYAAAGLAMGKTPGTPDALIRGFDWEATDDTSAAAMLRPAERDLFL